MLVVKAERKIRREEKVEEIDIRRIQLYSVYVGSVAVVSKLGAITLPKDKPLLLVCAVGGRSYAVAQVLQHQGYGELYNLNGGIAAWKEAGLPLQY